MEPLAQGSGLQPDPGHRQAEFAAEGDQRLGLAGELSLTNDAAAPIEDTDAALFQGHIDADIVLHARLPLIFEADPFGPHATIMLGDGHPGRQPSMQAHHGI
jgi:hypothetical protein